MIWRNFLIAYAASTAPGSYGISNRANEAVKYFPNDQELKNMQKLYVIGQDKINQSNSSSILDTTL